MATGGWPIELFVVNPEQDCAKCLDVLRDAVVHTCGKSFCATCVRDESLCPTCREPCSSWTPNLDLREMILKQAVHCEAWRP